jgi:hypothetical protein
MIFQIKVIEKMYDYLLIHYLLMLLKYQIEFQSYDKNKMVMMLMLLK